MPLIRPVLCFLHLHEWRAHVLCDAEACAYCHRPRSEQDEHKLALREAVIAEFSAARGREPRCSEFIQLFGTALSVHPYEEKAS